MSGSNATSTELTALELAALQQLLKNEGVEATPAELAAIRVEAREFTGVGFFTDLVKNTAIRVFAPSTEGMRGEAHAALGSSAHAQVGFVFYVDGGYVTMIEGYTYGEPWPEATSDFRILDIQSQKT